MSHVSIRAIVDGITALALHGLVLGARALPEGGRARLGGLLGSIAYACMGRRRAIADDNLRRAFPDMDEARRAFVARRSFQHFARVFFEVLPPSPRRMLAIADSTPVEGLEHLEAALAAGRGAFYVTAHLGNWEVMAHALARRGFPLSVVVRRTGNAAIDGMLDRLRTASGNEVIDKDVAVPRMREVLGRGGIVGILMDQNVLGSKAVFVDFLGGRAATTPVVGLLALRHRAPVLCGFTDREGFGRYRVRIVPLWSPGDGGVYRGKPGILALTQRLTSALDEEIRRSPETWLWSHDRFRTREGKRRRRIAVRMPNWLGDAVMAQPALAAIERAVPDADLQLLLRPPLAGLFRACGYAVIEVEDDGWRGERATGGHTGYFQAVLVLPNSVRAALGARRLLAKARVGFAGPGRGMLLSRLAPDPGRLVIHQVDRYLALVNPLLAAMGRPERARDGEDTVPTLRLREVPAGGPAVPPRYAVIAPGAAFGSAKRWDAEGFSSVAARMLENLDVLVVGGPDERELGARVASDAGSVAGRRALSLAGQTSLPQAAALLAGAAVVIANDSGLMHLAGALGAPVVGLFGATDPAVTGPRAPRAGVVRGEAPCSPCRHRACPVGRICWGRVSSSQVIDAARDRIEIEASR